MCSCSQQRYVCTTRKAFACRVDRAVIRMKDSVFVWPSFNSRLIIPCRIIRTILRGLNAASFSFFLLSWQYAPHCFPSHHTHFLSCVWVCCRMMFCLIFLFLLGYFYFIFSLFYFHVQLRHAVVRQCWLHASWFSCLYVLFTNYKSRTISETRLTREASIAWLSVLLDMFSFLSIRCCRILSNLLLLHPLPLFLLLLQREYYCHDHLYHGLFVFFQRTRRSGHVLPPLSIRPAHIWTSFGWQLLNNPWFNLKFLIPKFKTDASWQQQTCYTYSSVCVIW